MVRPTRFELVAFCFGGKRSIQAELRALDQLVRNQTASLDPLPAKGEPACTLNSLSPNGAI